MSDDEVMMNAEDDDKQWEKIGLFCLESSQVLRDRFSFMNCTTDRLRKWGAYLWTRFFKPYVDDDAISDADAVKFGTEAISEYLTNALVDMGHTIDELKNSGALLVSVQMYMWMAKWAHDGFPALTSGAKFCAALAASTVERSIEAEDFLIPWTTFLVIVPKGVIPSENGDVTLMAVNTVSDQDGNHSAVIMMCDRFIRALYEDGPLTDLLLREEVMDELGQINATRGYDNVGSYKCSPSWVRTCTLAKRVLAGLTLTLAHSPAFVNRPPDEGLRQTTSDGRQPPKHRTYFVGEPITVDCRPALRDYVSGVTRNAPAVQSLVRGHHKRQVIGVGRTGRKVIFVHPYWRGPEDAPILARSYRVGES